MGNRLSKIVTKTGDKGETGLAGGMRVSKNHPRIHALGEVDELNCCIGLLRDALPSKHELELLLSQIQHDLFDLGGQLAMPEHELFQALCLEQLETQLEKLNQNLPPLKEFILPAGSHGVAQAHFARAVCRRCERSLVTLNEVESLNPLLLQYINRLSDGLFIIARTLAHHSQQGEVLWQNRHQQKA